MDRKSHCQTKWKCIFCSRSYTVCGTWTGFVLDLPRGQRCDARGAVGSCRRSYAAGTYYCSNYARRCQHRLSLSYVRTTLSRFNADENRWWNFDSWGEDRGDELYARDHNSTNHCYRLNLPGWAEFRAFNTKCARANEHNRRPRVVLD